MNKDNSNKNTFHFFTPASSIVKAKGGNGEDVMRLGGVASTMDRDSDGEFLDPNGFDVSYLKKSGFVNWHHGVKDNPSTIIGEPHTVNLTKEGLNIEVDLYKNSKLAQQVYELAEVLEKNSTSRGLGFSIEGKAIERDVVNPKIIKKARITGVAITHMPKNHKTFANIIKGEIEDFDEDEVKINKSLEAKLIEAKIALADQILKANSKEEVVEDEEDEENKTEKSLNTENGVALKKEHVDGQEKNLKKSEIFSLIFDIFPDIEISKAKRAYNTIQKLIEMKKASENPTVEDIKKAMEILDIVDDQEEIKKGDIFGEDEDEGITKAKEDDEDSEDDENSGGDSNDEEEEEEEEKSKKKEIKKGKNIVFLKGKNNLFQKGIISESGEFESVTDELFTKKNNVFVKADNEENIEDLINKAVSKTEDKFASLLEKQSETINLLKSELEEISNHRNKRKSFKDVNQIEKSFNNGEGDHDLQKAGGKDGKVVSLSRNRSLVTQMLEKAAFSDINKGISNSIDPALSKAITVYETSGSMPADIRKMIETQENIVLES